mgnify:CR=1 FL=1
MKYKKNEEPVVNSGIEGTSSFDINNKHMKIHLKVFEKFISVNSKIEEILKRSTQKSKMITNLINDLLDLAKFENTVFKLNKTISICSK